MGKVQKNHYIYIYVSANLIIKSDPIHYYQN
jgi:hypothetical protein